MALKAFLSPSFFFFFVQLDKHQKTDAAKATETLPGLLCMSIRWKMTSAFIKTFTLDWYVSFSVMKYVNTANKWYDK